ncbi:MAG: ketopantoate reductase family protein [Promethearchaeota archaeon]
MTFQQIVILGAGAIGSTYGAAISKQHNVLLIGRGKHVEAINTGGLIIEGDFAGTYKPSAKTTLDEILPETLLVVTTKAYDVENSLQAIQTIVRKDTVVLLLQNGLGIIELAKRALKGKGVVVRGLITMAAEMLAPGHIKTWRGETILGSDKNSKKITHLFNESDLPVRVSETFEKELWKKLAMNCVINPLTAILRVRNKEIGVSTLAPIRHAIIRECIAISMAEGVELKADLISDIDKMIPRYTNLSSMYQDVKRGKQTEIDFINGKIVEFGKRHGIPTPMNHCLAQLVRFQEEHQF